MTLAKAAAKNATAFVSGANRGIGLAVIRALCRELGSDASVYLGARNLAQGQQAAESLASTGLNATPVRFDLTDAATHGALAERVGSSGLDVLVLNGAYAARPGVPAKDQVRVMIEANNHGNLAALETLAPHLNENARVLVVASGFGTLDNLPEAVRPKLGAPDATPEQIEAAMDDYVLAVEAGRETEEGWPEWINLPSKVGQVATVRAFVRRWDQDPQRPSGVLINAVCPGWTDTDAARPYLAEMPDVDAQTPDEAAVDLLWLATLPAGVSEPHGELIRHRKVLSFEAET